MANKRIKISELPKITYSRLAGSTSVTEQDYIPIAVTDPDNLAVKTTQTITTKQLQRFQLGDLTDCPVFDEMYRFCALYVCRGRSAGCCVPLAAEQPPQHRPRGVPVCKRAPLPASESSTRLAVDCCDRPHHTCFAVMRRQCKNM